MSKTHIYIVELENKETRDLVSERLVETNTANLAERHVINETVKARRATTRDVADLMGRGVKLETAGGDGK